MKELLREIKNLNEHIKMLIEILTELIAKL